MQLRLLSLFSGIGAFEKALGDKIELVNYCEIDKYAAKAYSLIHNVPEDLNLKDVTKVDTSKLKDIDLLTYGFPCVPKGYLVQTANGLKPIEDVTTDDHVLTHKNQYKKVLKTMSRISDHIYTINGVGCKIQLTDEHPLYIYRNGSFVWVQTKDLNTVTDRIVYNINTRSIRKDISNDVLWLIGRYFADGYKENHTPLRPIFCIGKTKTSEFEERVKDFKHNKIHGERSCVEYRVTDERITSLIDELKTGAANKEIPNWVIDLPLDQLSAFYAGYFSGDGHARKDRNTMMMSTVSKKLCFGLMQIIIKLFNKVPTLSIRVDNRKESYNDVYTLQFSPNAKNQLVIDDHICVDIKSVTRDQRDIEVFNIEVADDNSYTVNNVIVHNCQDISQAGKQKGFVDDNGNITRSGLFFEALRIIKDTQPKYAIAENVKALTGKKFESEFSTVLESLDRAGYNNYWKVLNAKDFGIPQNRERVFIVSIRKDVDDGSFCFPKPQPLNICLKDVLEENVDEKFYLSQDKIKSLKASSFCLKTKCVIEKEIEIVGHTKSGGERSAILSTTGICNCLSASDYKQPKQIVEDAKVMQVGNLRQGNGWDNPQCGRVYDINGLSPTLNTMQGGGREPKIIKPNIGVHPLSKKLEFDGFHTDFSPCLLATDYKAPKCTLTNSFRIRKLTPLECWRLMGFDDDDFYKARNAGISNSQLYKQAGNSIVVNVLRAIFRELLKVEARNK